MLAEDGETICAAGGAGVRVYCQRRRRMLRRSEVGTAPLTSCAQLRGFDLLCLGSTDAALHLYSVGRGQAVQSLPAGGSVAALALGEAGLLCCSAAGARLHRLVPSGLSADGDQLLLPAALPPGSGLASAALHPGLPLAAAGALDGGVVLWDLRSGGPPVRTWREEQPPGCLLQTPPGSSLGTFP